LEENEIAYIAQEIKHFHGDAGRIGLAQQG